MKLKCTLEINDTGTLAELYYMNGLRIARIGVHGPLLRACKGVKSGHDDGIQATLYSLADSQYVDKQGEIQETHNEESS